MGQALPTAKLPREVDVRFERGPKLSELAKDDVVGKMLAVEQIARDDTLFDEKIKITREAVSVCYKQYHVNHAFKCRPIYLEYLRMIQHKNHIIHDYPAEIEAPAAQ